MIDRWVRWLQIEKGALPNTIRAYRRELEYLAKHWADGKPETLQTEDLRDYLQTRGGKPGTINKRISALTSFYRYLIRVDARLDDPTLKIDRPKARKGLPRPVDTIHELLLDMDSSTQQMAVFLLETGLRISEACSIRITPPAPDLLRVRGKGAKERLVPLTDDARKAIDWLGGAFGINPRAVQRRFQPYGFSPHQLRHTYACELAEAGCDLGDIQELLGHESAQTTKVYARFSVDRLRAAQARRSVHLVA